MFFHSNFRLHSVLHCLDCRHVGHCLRNSVNEIRVFDHLVGHVLHHVLGELILELFLLVLREVVLDLSFSSADVGHEVGGLLGNLLIVVGQIGAYVLCAAAAVLILGAGLGLFALRARLGFRDRLRDGLRLGNGIRNGLGDWFGLLDHSSGWVP